jgi:hypothetical protein
MPVTIKTYEAWQGGGLSNAAREAGKMVLGVDFWNKQFNLGWMMTGLFPIIAGGVIHRFVGGRLGVNRALARAGIPVIRL